MSEQEVKEKLKENRIEDFIWVIYLGIIILSYYSNTLEDKYFKNNDLVAREKYRHIMIFIFSILVVVYLYFLYESYKDIKKLKESDSTHKITLVYLSFIGSLFIVLSGLIFLYVAYNDEDLSVEIAFN